MRAISRVGVHGVHGPPSFEAFFEETYESVLRVAYLMAGSRPDAEELAQEAFARAYERWDKVGSSENPAGYVYRTAVNLHRGNLRRIAVAARRHVRISSVDEIAAADERDSIRRALRRLSRAEREAVVLVDWLGMNDQEAAPILRTSPGAVRVRVSRARRKLQTELSGGGNDD